MEEEELARARGGGVKGAVEDKAVEGNAVEA